VTAKVLHDVACPVWTSSHVSDDHSALFVMPKVIVCAIDPTREGDVVLPWVAKTGYDPNYGARPLKRAIQKQVETRLGRLIIEGKVHDGEEVVVDYDAMKDQLAFQPMPVLA
jgi:hypothetical protein